MRSALFFIVSVLFLTACKEKVTKKPTLEVTKQTVQSFENPSEENSHLPRLFSNGTELYFSWVSQKDSVDVLSYSVLKDKHWTASSEIIRGNDWFTNWADFPTIAENNGNILTSFLQKSAIGTYTYDVKLNLYNAKNKTWKKNFILHKDGTQSEHGFVTIRPYVENSFFITWLDGRETVDKGHGGGQMTLRSAIVFEDGSIDYDRLLDDKVCDCCQTSAAIGTNDELIVAYRNRSDEEIRDISIVRWEKDAGWLAPKTIGNDNWMIAGCPVNGPAIDVFQGSLVAAWFTGANEEGKVNITFSNDEGRSFQEVIRVDAGDATGRVDVVMISATEAVVLWMEPQGENELIQVMKVTSDGKKGNPLTVSKTSAARASGFPQLELLDDTLYFAWTLLGENKQKTIEVSSLSVSKL